jgi:hypothetical protein
MIPPSGHPRRLRHRARLRPESTAALLLALACSSCLVTPVSEEATIALSTSLPLLPADARPSAPLRNETFNPWDRYGYFQLSLFPKLVRVAVESSDYELASGTWPNPEQGIGAGEGPGGEVSVELRVPAGADRRVRALGFIADPTGVLVYEEQAAPSLTLVAGMTTDLTLPMVRGAWGRVVASARCEAGDAGPWDPVAVSLVDAKAFVIHPSQALRVDPSTQTLGVEIASVPVGRYHWPRTILQHRQSGEVKVIDLRQLTFLVKTQDERSLVNIVLPCDSL